MSIAHIAIPVGAHYAAMRDFYAAILKPIGYEIMIGNKDGAEMCGMGSKATGPVFWLGLGKNNKTLPKYDGNMENRIAPIHLAFSASSTQEVDEWYANALKHGGVDNGPPGDRKYSVTFYAAFVLDPLGNNIEVMHLKQ